MSQVPGEGTGWSPSQPPQMPPAPWSTGPEAAVPAGMAPPAMPLAAPAAPTMPAPTAAEPGVVPPATGQQARADLGGVINPTTMPSGPSVVSTDGGARDGLKKCARCGSTDIALNVATGNLRCNFCRYEAPGANALATYHLDGDPKFLTGMVLGSGSSDIVPGVDEVMTFKCGACGAEVVVDTKSAMQARCHWCRNTLSVNQQIPNGAVPDMILPFSITKDVAVERINEFVGKRMTFAHPRFKAEFEAGNVMGVYLPYMVVDANTKIDMAGQGEHLVRSYTVKNGDNEETKYDADLYNVTRSFDLYIDDLTVESSSQRLDQTPSRNSNNIINAIMPFDVQNSVVYDSNYLTGFGSEKRDTNLADLAPILTAQSQDIARYHANSTLTFYDRGVRWDNEQINVIGQRWVSAYLPVWLYSYFDPKTEYVHYVAVNGRTGETMGSVPINYPKLTLISIGVEIIGIILAILIFIVGG